MIINITYKRRVFVQLFANKKRKKVSGEWRLNGLLLSSPVSQLNVTFKNLMTDHSPDTSIVTLSSKFF